MKSRALVVACVVWAVAAGAVLADGMIVPVQPELRVRGNWAVKYHHVDIIVRDQVASVTIDQEFVNTGEQAIEVEYLFPVPPEAAIDAMTLSVDGKDFAAKLLKADEARRIYEDIVRRKKDPALLEYVGFGLYKTSAFPLEKGKPAKVIVHYTCVCKKDRDLVEVWYPLNTEKFSATSIEDVTVTVDVKTAADITAVYSPTHDLAVERKDPRHTVATYHATNTLPATDFQVFYRSADEAIGATLLTTWPQADEDGYFLALISPNPRSAAATVAAKDIVLVLDRSGSMSGEKLTQAKEAAAFVLSNLNAEDRFNVVAYSDSVETVFDALVAADAAHVEQARDRLERISAGGGTNIHEALETALERHWPRGKDVPADHPLATRPKYVLFLTDGLPTVGVTDEAKILANTKEHNGWGARLFAFGVGYDVNVRLLDKLVADARGRSDYLKPKEPIESKVSSLYTKIRNPVMTDLKLEIKGLTVRDVYPRELGDLFEGDQIVITGRLDRSSLRDVLLGGTMDTRIAVTGRYEGKERTFEYPVTVAGPGKEVGRYAFVQQLWAVRRVGWLLDQIQLHGENKEVIDELVKLSLAYGIITPYTSFLADETTQLNRPRELADKAVLAARPLSEFSSGAAGQVNAMNRQAYNQAVRAPAASGPAGVQVMGYGVTDTAAYEAGQVQMVTTVRQAGNQAVYRRKGNVWVAANASGVDLENLPAGVQTVERFGEEYFRLVGANTVAENQVLASQQPGEELVITLRGQVYRIR
jgi:Ca-activated chloride channel family protein